MCPPISKVISTAIATFILCNCLSCTEKAGASAFHRKKGTPIVQALILYYPELSEDWKQGLSDNDIDRLKTILRAPERTSPPLFPGPTDQPFAVKLLVTYKDCAEDLTIVPVRYGGYFELIEERMEFRSLKLVEIIQKYVKLFRIERLMKSIELQLEGKIKLEIDECSWEETLETRPERAVFSKLQNDFRHNVGNSSNRCKTETARIPSPITMPQQP